MKKILHISKYFHPYYGGIEDVAKTIIDELKPYFEQRVICFGHEKETTSSVNGIEVLRIKTIGTIGSQPVSFSYKQKLQKLIDSYRPDYIHIHLPNPLISIYLLYVNIYDAKIITHWHADILGQQYFYWLYKPLEKRILERSYKIIATSKAYLNNSLPLQSFQQKTTILPNTVNEDKLKIQNNDQSNIEKLKIQYENKKIIFFVGRHVPYKGIDYLIEAEKSIKEDCVIVIAGVGEQTARLLEKAGKNKRIQFVGKLSNTELKQYLYASTVFAFPSHTRSEAFGVALAEALYCGLPAISFEIKGSGVNWVNKNNYTGLVVENKNVAKFAEALSSILSSDSLRDKLSVNAKEWVKHNFLKNQIVTAIHKIYS